MKTAIEQLLEWMDTDLPRIKDKLDQQNGEPIIRGRLLYFLEVEKKQMREYANAYAEWLTYYPFELDTKERSEEEMLDMFELSRSIKFKERKPIHAKNTNNGRRNK